MLIMAMGLARRRTNICWMHLWTGDVFDTCHYSDGRHGASRWPLCNPVSFLVLEIFNGQRQLYAVLAPCGHSRPLAIQTSNNIQKGNSTGGGRRTQEKCRFVCYDVHFIDVDMSISLWIVILFILIVNAITD